MANEKHLLLTAIGDWDDSLLAGESWQVGIRLALVMGSVDDVGTLPNNWNPAATTINRTETDWTITGNWLATSGTPTFHPDDYLNDQAAPAFSDWLSDGATGTSSKARLRQLKVFPIGTNGKAIPAPPYSSGTPCELTWTGSYPTGGTGSSVLPLQNSIVMSHRSNQIGRRGRGRVFRPGPTTASINSHAQLDSGVVAGLLAAHIALLEALSVTGVGIDAPTVRPIVTGSPFTQYGVINQVRVGNIMDTQRRRRRSLVETTSSGTPSY